MDLRPAAKHKATSAPADSQRPSQQLDSQSEEAQLLLEEMDDAVFTALQGCRKSLDKTRTLWPQVVDSVGWDLVDESREQYLRFAIETTVALQEEETRTPERSAAALEVISLLIR